MKESIKMHVCTQIPHSYKYQRARRCLRLSTAHSTRNPVFVQKDREVSIIHSNPTEYVQKEKKQSTIYSYVVFMYGSNLSINSRVLLGCQIPKRQLLHQIFVRKLLFLVC